MSSINDPSSTETPSTDPSMGTVETNSRLSYQDAMSQARPLDLVYFKKKPSSGSAGDSYSSKHSHAGIVVNSELLPSVPGLKAGRYYVLQASSSNDPNSNGTVAPAPDADNDPTDSTQNTQTKYYGLHLTELGTVLKRYTNADSSSGVALAKLKDNPYVQGANETSSKYKKRKKTLVTQTDQFYQKSKPRTLGRKLFGMVRKSTKRPEGLKFSDLNLHTGSTYNHSGPSWSTDPVQQYYQHMGWLKVPEPAEDSSVDAATPIVTATPAPTDVAPISSSKDVDWAAPGTSGNNTDPTNASGDAGSSLTINTDPSAAPPTTTGSSPITPTNDASSSASDPPATSTSAAPAPVSGLTVNTSGSSPPTPTNAAGTASSPATPTDSASSASSGTLDNLNTIVEDPTEMYLAPTDTIDDPSDYQPPSSPTAAITTSSAEDASTVVDTSAPAATATTPTASADGASTIATVVTPTAASATAAATTVDTGSDTSTSTAPVAESAVTPTVVPTSSVAPTPSASQASVATPSSSSTTASPTVPTASAAMSSPNTSNVTTSSTPYAAAPSTDTEYW
jgi:hypothetical protein